MEQNVCTAENDTRPRVGVVARIADRRTAGAATPPRAQNVTLG
jgi:hypothetical protein